MRQEHRLDESDVERAMSDDVSTPPEEDEAYVAVREPERPESLTPEELEAVVEDESEAVEETSLHVDDDLIEAVLDEGPELSGFNDDDTEWEIERHEGQVG